MLSAAPIRIGIPDAILIPLALQASIPAIALDRALTVIGSGPGVQLRMRTRTVEGIHAAILNADDRVLLRDLSNTGVFVNGNRVKEQILQNEDHVAIGKVVFQFMGVLRDPQEEQANAPRARLSAAERHATVDTPLFLIGRSEICQLQLDADGVAEKHALIFAAGGQHFIRLLDSGSKLRINGNDTRQSRLSEGDVIQIGETGVRYSVPEASDSSPIELPAESFKSVDRSHRQADITNDRVIEQYPAGDSALEGFDSAQPASIAAPPDQAQAPGKVSDTSRSRLRRIHTDDSPGSRVAELDIESVRDWGPLAVAMVKVQHVTAADEDFGQPQETETANAPQGRSARLWMLVVLAVIVIAGVAGWLLYRMN